MIPGESSSLPTVSVIVPTRNNARELMRDLVPSLFARKGEGYAQDGQYSPEASPWRQTIIVDQSQSSETRDALEREGLLADPRFLHLWTPEQRGISRARNAGIARATSEIVAFLDSDIIVKPEHVLGIARIFAQHPEIDAMFGPVLAHEPTWKEHGSGAIPAFVPSAERVLGERAHDVECGMGANFAQRRRQALAFPFDEFLGAGAEFPSHEEVDQVVRMKGQGHACGLFLEPSVLHTGIRVGKELGSWAADTERGRGGADAKRLVCGDWASLAEGPTVIFKLVWSNFKASGRPSGIKRFLPYYAGFCRGLASYQVDRNAGVFSGKRVWFERRSRS